MIKRTLGAIAAMCGGTLNDSGHAALTVAGISKDTRHIKPGQLYVPLAGERFDGHDFAEL